MSAPPGAPRVLFITPAAFNRTTGGGITFGNLFAGWPKDRLATAHTDPIPTTTETCERYFELGPREIRRAGVLERLAPAAGGGAAAGHGAPRGRARVLRAAKWLVFGDQLPDRGALSDDLARWIEAFHPELLYTILGTNAMMQLVDAVQRRFALPLVAHMMDDWPATSYRGGALGPVARRRMDRLLRELLRRADGRFGICDAMCAAYARRYGVPFEPFQNTIDLGRWSALAKSAAAPAAAPDVVYIGSILPLAQLQSLADCCRAVADLAREGLGIRLSIYSPAAYAERHRRQLVIDDSISLEDTITDDESFFRRLAAADVLLLPVNFDRRAIDLLRYSMPTKVPAYLASGTPILAYGPAEVAQIRYALASGWAHVVCERGARSVREGLRRLLADAPLRTSLSERARRTAAQFHDSTSVRTRFQSRLAQLARAKGPTPVR
jgi:glycosyltransferase involved in cell wall biosynthesis